MTEQEIAEIEARANAATPGPWSENEDAYFVETRADLPSPDDELNISPGDYIAEVDALENMKFIAHAREDIPRLIAEVRRLRAALDEVEFEHALELGMVSAEDIAKRNEGST